MNKRILWSLAVAIVLFGGTAVAATQGMSTGMMAARQGPGMMYGSAPATQAGPETVARPGYPGMGRGMMYGYGGYGMGPGMMGGYGHYGMGPGMMGGYGGYGMGPGMMGGYGHYGMGPGMMGGYGGYGMGPGMMGGYGHYGMGPGMMMGGYGGYGMGPGMMMGGYGHYGMGPGMMYGYGGRALGLSAEQRGKLAGIWNDAINKAWPIMGQLREQYFRFARLMGEENPDRAAVNKVYTRISDLRKQLLGMRLDARQQMMEVLSADQRKKLQQGFYHHWQ